MDNEIKENLNLLLIVDDTDDAIRLENVFNLAGYNVMIKSPSSVEDLSPDLNRYHWDLLFYGLDREGVSLANEINKAHEFQKDLAVLILHDDFSPDVALRAGARDLVSLVDSSHLLYVCRRELEVNGLRKSIDSLQITAGQDYDVNTTFIVGEDDIESMEIADSMVSTIESCIESQAIKLDYQPIFTLIDDSHSNYEVFSRLLDESGKIIMPNVFIPIAERFGLAQAVDRLVVLKVIDRLKLELRKNPEVKLRFFVNMSMDTLGDSSALSHIVDLLSEANLPKGSFVFEVSKNSVLSKVEATKSLFKEIDGGGLRFSLDHYEIEDISLNYLDQIKVDYLGIDSGIISQVGNDPGVIHQIEAIVAAAHNKGLKVIAHGVETPAIMVKIYNLGVDYMQGYAVQVPDGNLEFEFSSGK